MKRATYDIVEHAEGSQLGHSLVAVGVLFALLWVLFAPLCDNLGLALDEDVELVLLKVLEDQIGRHILLKKRE